MRYIVWIVSYCPLKREWKENMQECLICNPHNIKKTLYRHNLKYYIAYIVSYIIVFYILTKKVRSLLVYTADPSCSIYLLSTLNTYIPTEYIFEIRQNDDTEVPPFF